MPVPPSSLSSAVILSATALGSKAFLSLSTQAYKVHGLNYLTDALKGEGTPLTASEKGDERAVLGDGCLPRRGILTVCNHNSVVDDPMMWSILPMSTFFPLARPSHTCHNLRWTLGASDIMFTSPPLSKFFTAGQVIETVRGAGIYQPAVDTAIKRVESGGWVHIFPEGRVNQPKNNPDGGMYRFKWGVGRILMDANVLPEIIPMWISGFDQIMDEKRGAPRFVPRTGAKISITVGAPLTTRIQPLVDAFRAGARDGSGDEDPTQTRIRVVQELQDAVQQLGEAVEEREGRFDAGSDVWSQSRRRGEIASS